MLAKVESRAVNGVRANAVDVEIDLSNGGMAAFSIVGLPDTACREAIKRVAAAIRNSGFRITSRRVTVNLAPANLKKEGTMYDLAIALGILCALGKVPQALLKDKVVCGELSLDGSVRPIKGALVIADEVRSQNKELVIPGENITELADLKDIRLIPVSSLNQLIYYLLEGGSVKLPLAKKYNVKNRQNVFFDYSSIKGNSHAKRALEVAVSGGHNIMLIGPPGVGKTLMARSLPGIMEYLDEEEAIETSKIYSIAGLLSTSGRGLIKIPPFRILHHSISGAGMIGGGSIIKPGEISLAHNGVLFLDEATEFRRDVLESLRLPLEEGVIRLSRANSTVIYPSKFMLVAAMNPCPCGYLTHPEKECNCSSIQIQKYLSKISGPLLDRIDMHIELFPIQYEQMRSTDKLEFSRDIRKRVVSVRALQKDRYKGRKFRLNSQLPHSLVNDTCKLTEDANILFRNAMKELFMSARAYDKVLKIARTIADMRESELIEEDDISEAIGYRRLDTKMWLGD
ncbi:MAG: YifB family Mg chelatase-like AAA ATPase [Candidatus Omnitrophota bacterium]